MACLTDAHRLLYAGGELTAMFPEGYKGAGQTIPGSLQVAKRFGRGGFVSSALWRAGADRAVLDHRRRRSTRCSPTSNSWPRWGCPTS